MALSRITKIAPGGTNTFQVAFALGYGKESDVTARVGDEADGLGQPIYRTIDFSVPGYMTLSGATIPVDTEVVFERTEDRSALNVDWADGADVTDENLDAMQLQSLRLVHEALDGRFEEITENLDVNGHRAVNVANPISANDAANKEYVDQRLQDISGAVTGVPDRIMRTGPNGFYDVMSAQETSNLNAIAAAGLPNNNNLGVSGSGVARRDNVKVYVDARAPDIKPARFLIDNAAGTLRESVARAETVERLGLSSLKLPMQKIIPTVVTNEIAGYLSPNAQTWVDGSGTARMTSAFYGSVIDDFAAAGIEHYIEMYAEGWGNWYWQPQNFAIWANYETGSPIVGKYWRDNIALPARDNYENFDPMAVRLARCEFYGIKFWMGIGRQGDVNLMGDLFGQAVIPGWTDPLRYGGMTLADRLHQAKRRALLIAQDLWQQYGSYSVLAGFKPGHEPSHIPSASAYYQDVVKNGYDGLPSLNSYKGQRPSFKTMIVPARLIESGVDITDTTYVQAVIDNGSDVWVWQSASGPGMSYALNDYTWLPYVTYSANAADNRQKYAKRLRTLIERTNGYAQSNGVARTTTRRLENWSIDEQWRMGRRPAGTLSIAAGYNTPGTTGVTFTCTGQFTGAIVGATISTITGKATVTDASGAPNSVVCTINRAFSANSFVATLWAWSNGYTKPYPKAVFELNSEFGWEGAHFERTALYSANFFSNPTGSLKPPVTQNDVSWRTLSETLYTGLLTQAKSRTEKAKNWIGPIMVNRRVVPRVAVPVTAWAIAYTAKSAPFTVGQIVSGPSGSAVILDNINTTGTTGVLKVGPITGTIANGAALTDPLGGAATANLPSGVTSADAEITVATFAPAFPGTTLSIALEPRASKAPAVVQPGAQGNLTVHLLINGFVVNTSTFYDNDGWCNANGIMGWEHEPNGAECTIGIRVQSWGGLTSPTSHLLRIEEWMLP